MYSPPHYRNENSSLAFEVIQRHDFATVISATESGPLVSHLPLLLVDNKELIGHCARANPHWKHFRPGHKLTAVFHGPHAYISPAWYKDKPDNVPTWNYVSVHVVGEATLIEDPAESFSVVRRLSEFHETRLGTGWKLPADSEKILSGLVKAIVSFRIRIDNIDAKYKLNQKQDSEERRAISNELRRLGEKDLADWMTKI